MYCVTRFGGRALLQAKGLLTSDTRKIFVSKTVDESYSARVLIGCKPIKGLTIFNGLVRRALLRTSCLGLTGDTREIFVSTRRASC